MKKKKKFPFAGADVSAAPGVSRRTLLAGDEETGMEHLVGRPKGVGRPVVDWMR